MQRISMMAGIVVLILVVIGVILSQRGRGFETVSAQEAQKLLSADTTVVLLDVRTEAEFQGELGHLAGAILIPIEDLEKRLEELSAVKGRTIIAYCRSGRRSANAAALLAQRGFTVYNLEGGILNWRAAGFPVINEHSK